MLKNLQIRSKVLLLAITILVLLVLTSGYALKKMFNIGQELELITGQNLPLLELVTSVEKNQIDQSHYFERAMRYMQNRGTDYYNEQALQEAKNGFDKHSRITSEKLAQIGKRLDKAMQTAKGDKAEQKIGKMQETLARIKNEHEDYKSAVKQIFKATQAEEVQKSKELTQKLEVNEQQMIEHVEEFYLVIENLMETSTNQALKAEKASFYSMVWGAVGAIIIALILSVFIITSITKPMNKVLALARRIAGGELQVENEVSRKDEIGDLARSVGSIRDTLINVLTEFDNTVYEVELGKLETRGNPDKFEGEFANLIKGSNTLADTLNKYIEEMPVPVVTFSKDFDVLYMNKAASNTVDRGKKECKGQKCYDLFNTGDCKTDQCATYRAMKEGQRTSSQTVASPDGKNQLEIEYFAQPIWDRNQDIVGGSEFILDHTEIKQVQRRIEEVAREAKDVSEQLASSAEELSSQVEQASQGAEEQNNRSSEASTAMEEMNSSIMEISRNASQTSDTAEHNKQKAQEGAQAVEKAVNLIQQVQEKTQSLERDVENMQEQAEGIESIMNTISDIADQTNLLALNAAIEAARAGESGKGFAVVADEVRKLAEKTMSATKEVESYIHNIQQSSKSNVSSSQEVARLVNENLELVRQSGDVLQELVDTANKNAELVQNIATATEQQTSASEEVGKTSMEINRIAKETSEAMNQSAQAITDLSKQAQKLNDLIEYMNES